MNRREWLKKFGGAGALFLASPSLMNCQKGEMQNETAKQILNQTARENAKIAFIKTTNRADGVKRAIELLNFKNEFKGKNLFLKPNFNSADATPGSTHNDTLRALMSEMRALGAKEMTVGDRSGMGNTREVMTFSTRFSSVLSLGTFT